MRKYEKQLFPFSLNFVCRPGKRGASFQVDTNPWVYFRFISGISLVHLSHILSISKVYLIYISGSTWTWVNLGYISGISQVYLGYILGIPRLYLRSISGISQSGPKYIEFLCFGVATKHIEMEI